MMSHLVFSRAALSLILCPKSHLRRESQIPVGVNFTVNFFYILFAIFFWGFHGFYNKKCFGEESREGRLRVLFLKGEKGQGAVRLGWCCAHSACALSLSSAWEVEAGGSGISCCSQQYSEFELSRLFETLSEINK